MLGVVDRLTESHSDLTSSIAAKVSDLASKLLALVDGLLLGGGNQAPNPTEAPSTLAALQDLAAKVRQLTDMLLNSPTDLSPSIAEKVSDLATKLLALVGGLLGGGDQAPSPTGMPSAPAALQDLSTSLADKVSALATKLLGLIDGLRGGLLGGGDQAPSPTDVPSAPAALQGLVAYLPLIGDDFSMPYYYSDGTESALTPNQAPPVPSEPSPVSIPSGLPPVSTSLSGSGFLSSGGGASALLLGVLASFSILVLSGKFLWSSCTFLKPDSVLHLAIERPG
jgi:hypothetical protein